MLFDLQSMFSDDQSLAGADELADVPSTNIIDLGAVQTPKHAKAAITRDLGKGRPIPVVIQITQTFTGDITADGLKVVLQMDNDEAFGSPTNVVTVDMPATLAAGNRAPIFYIPEGVTERYARLLFDLGDACTAGRITAGLVFGRANWSA